MDEKRLHQDYLAHVAALTAAVGRAAEAQGYAGVVIHSGTAQKRTIFDDQFWPLRPSPFFQHFIPLATPDCVLVVRAGATPRLVRNVARDYWDGLPQVEDARVFAAFEVIDVTDPVTARDHFGDGRLALVGEDAARATSWGFAEADVRPAGLMRALEALRVHKSAYEKACLVEANRRAALGHAAVREAFFAGDASELDLHLAFLKATAQDDAETPYKNIVALDHHGAVLHHVYYARSRQPATALLLDAGATCRGYASDVTRTFVKGQGASAGATAFAALVAGLEQLQQATCAAVRVGDRYEMLHDHAHVLLGGVLRDVGVATASVDELVASGATRAFLPHGLGHSLGLTCHDVGCALEKPRADNPFLRNTSVIEPDQVFTIEPGCYFIPEKLDALRAAPVGKAIDWTTVNELARYGGVRIEDDVLVRPAGQGVENFTRAFLPA